MTHLHLRSLRLRAAEEYRDEREIDLEPFELGAQRYLPVPDQARAEVVVARATSGTVFELRFRTRLHGPCMRCLEDAVVDVAVDSREYQAAHAGGSEELGTPYLVDDRLDLSAWARDAIALALPGKILCRADCAGLCPVCGKNLSGEPHEHDESPRDLRWAALEALRERL